MAYRRIGSSCMEQLWELQKAYKAEIGEDAPTEQNRAQLQDALEENERLRQQLENKK